MNSTLEIGKREKIRCCIMKRTWFLLQCYASGLVVSIQKWSCAYYKERTNFGQLQATKNMRGQLIMISSAGQ